MFDTVTLYLVKVELIYSLPIGLLYHLGDSASFCTRIKPYILDFDSLSALGKLFSKPYVTRTTTGYKRLEDRSGYVVIDRHMYALMVFASCSFSGGVWAGFSTAELSLHLDMLQFLRPTIEYMSKRSL